MAGPTEGLSFPFFFFLPSVNGNSHMQREVTVLGAAALEKHEIEVGRRAVSQALLEM